MADKIYTVYILHTSRNTLYTGQTNNLSQRLQQHRQKSVRSAKYMRTCQSFTLVYTENFASRSEALRREAAIKKLTRVQKDYLISSKKMKIDYNLYMKAKNFSLPDQNNQLHQLSDYLGNWVVLYFYPKDDTPGCTVEACSFRDSLDSFKNFGVQVLGVSKDSVKAHQKFVEKYHLNFPLLSDETHAIISDYDAWGAKKFMGREFQGTIRKTYLIDPQGEIKKVYPKVNPREHIPEILKDIQNLKAL